MFAIRGTASTGFRAPTLAESYYSATNVSPTSAFVQLAPNSPGRPPAGHRPAEAREVDQLQPRHRGPPDPEDDGDDRRLSDHPEGPHLRLQLGLRPAQRRGGQQPNVNAAIAANGNVLDSTVTSTGINIFSNGLDTRTRGLDFVVSYPTDLGDYGHIDWTLSGNFNKTKITKVKTPPAALATTSVAFPTGQVLFAGNAASLLEKASPKYKIGLNGLYTFGRLLAERDGDLLRQGLESLSDPGTGPLLNTVASASAITDAELSYKFPKSASSPRSGPTTCSTSTRTSSRPRSRPPASPPARGCTTQYPTFSPYGINGGYYYGRLTFSF
jgi:iron complex outermembrane receptor protein